MRLGGFGKLLGFGKPTPEAPARVVETAAVETAEDVAAIAAAAEEQKKSELMEEMNAFRERVQARMGEGKELYEAQTNIVVEEISDGLDINAIAAALGGIKAEINVAREADFEEFNRSTSVTEIYRLGELLFAGKPKEGVALEIYYQAINEIGLRIAKTFDHQVSVRPVYPGYAIQIEEQEVSNKGSGNKVGKALGWGCEIPGQSHTRFKPKVEAVREEDQQPFVGTSFLYPEDL